MFSKNNTKMNNKKQYEKVNHYGIKKFNAGTASVLIASAFMFLGGAAQAADTNKQEATVAVAEKATATEEKAEVAQAETQAVAPKTEVKEETTVKAAAKEEKAEETKAEKATAKEVNKTALQAKISQLDNLFVSLAGQELSEDKQVKTVSAAVELNKAKDLAAQATATQEQVDAQVASLEAAINNLNKVEKTADKKEEAKKEEKSETKVAKEELEKAVSEAKAVNQAATTFATKEVKEEAPKAEIKAVVATSEKEIAKALDIFNSDSSTKEDADQQRKELEKAIEAVYVTMQRAGHRGKVEAVLADTPSKITGKDVFRDGETVNAVTNAYVDMNADNTAPTGWGVDTTISTSTLKAGSITKIELTNLAELGAGLAVNTEIRATDGTVVGKVKSIDYKTTTGNNNNKSTPYWAQRTQRGMTYDQRVAEQPAVANETGTYTYNIDWNDKVKDYPNVSFGASNLSGDGYLAPQISKDTPYTATIKIDGRTVLEHTYTRKGQQPSYQKQGTSASLSENNGLTYLNNELKSRSDSIVLKTDSDVRYGVGSKFTIKLPNADFTEFKELEGSSSFVNGLNTASTIKPNKGDSITYRPQNRWSNARANENNVWILQDGRDSGFTLTPRLISPTELELTVTEGTIQEDSIVSMPLQSLGIEKVVKDKTLTSEYSNITYENGLIKQGYVGNDKTAATLTVSGGESINGGKEDVITKVPNGWSINGDGKVQGEPPTGAVVRTFKDLVTGEVIGFEPTRYTGNIPLSEDGSKDYTNVLGNKYNVANDNVDLVKEVNGEEYILADIPAENTQGTLSVTKTRARDLFSEEELKAKGVNGSAFVNPVNYDYVKKTKVEEVNRTIKFVYADDAKDLAGTEVFPSQKQTVSYTGKIKLTAQGKAVVNSDDKPVYIDWTGTNGQSTDLPELVVPQKEGYIASVEKVPVQATNATDEDYEFVVKYSPIQKATVNFVSVDANGKETPLDEKYNITNLTGKFGDTIPETQIQARLDVLKSMGYTVKENPFDQDPQFDSDADTDQNFTIKLTPKVSTPTPVYVVEGDKPTAEELKGAVTTEGNDKTVDETKIPETTGKVGDDTLTAPVTVTYGSGDNKREETVNVPVKVVKGYPQLVAVSEDKKQPSPEDSIDPSAYPDDATFEYKEEVDTTTPGDKKVTVVVKQGDKVLVEVPATVRVVDSTPQFVVVDKDKKQPDVKSSITPEEYPEGTTFKYKEPVDTTTAGEKEVTVVATLDGNTLVEVPAKVMVVSPETQYVFEDPAKPQPTAEESINPDQYPEGTKFTYKDGEVDTTTPGDKKVTVVAKNGEDKLVEVPAVVKVLPVVKPEGLTVLKGSENLEAAVKAKAEEVVAALPKDKVPEGVTVKVKEVKAGTTPTTSEVTETGKPKPATVVIEYTDDKGNVIGTKEVEVPVTVVGSTTKPVVVFEGDKPTKAKDAVTPGQGGTVGEPTTLPDTAGKAGATDVTVEVPVTYAGIKDPEKVTVPVTVLPVAKGDVTVAKGTTPDKLKELAKAKAQEAVNAVPKDKLPKDATVTVGDVTEEVLAKLTAEKGTNTGTVNVPVTYKIPGDDTPYTTTIPVTVNVVEALPKLIETPVTKTTVTKDDIAKYVQVPEGGKVTNVENIPDLTTPGKKDPVKVTVELPNSQTITVDVPVNVTPVKEVETPVTKTPLTKEDYTKGITIPEGGKVTNVENLPDLTTPGKKDPVKVTVELPNGKVVTVEVPVNVTPVKEIETPVTKTPLTPEDYTKGIKIPEGGKVTNVENIPDLTTPGKKDPVKVTVELPNGKVITVEVPVNVTPVKEIETPVTKTPLTPEDYTKGIKIPEGGKVTNVENIPDLTTPGKKDPVKVTVELPNGKVITVEVPVTVTPINEIVKNVGDPITNEDVEKNVKIPEGGKIISIGEKPGTESPGVKPVVPVVIELPNGKQITVEVPVIVKPKVTPVVVKVGTPVTEEDVKKHVDLPEGWKVTKVGEIPTTATPGEKTSVPVEVELPDGRKVTVEVPVIVTPKVSTIIVPQGTVITPEDVKNHIDLPKEPGWEIVEVGEIPSTVPAGVKPSVKVKVKLPNGRVIDLEVPIISTPKVTPIVVEVGTPITKDDVKKHIELPKEPGWEIVEVGEIPTTETPGQKTAVKVKVKLPTGEIVEVEVPVTVTPKATPAPRETVKTTPIVVEVGTPITQEDVKKHVELPKGAEIVEIGEIPTSETAGQKPSVKVKVKLPTGEIVEVEVPVTVTPKVTLTPRPEKPSTPEATKAPVAKAGEKVLPNTGIADNNSALAGLGLAILGLAAAARRRKQK